MTLIAICESEQSAVNETLFIVKHGLIGRLMVRISAVFPLGRLISCRYPSFVSLLFWPGYVDGDLEISACYSS